MNKMQERDKFNTSCRKHSVEITIDQVTRHIAWKRDDCPVCRIISLEQQLQQAHRDATEEVAKAHKRGWEQGKKEAFEIARTTQIGYIQTTIAAMEYNEKEELKNWCDIEGVAP